MWSTFEKEPLAVARYDRLFVIARPADIYMLDQTKPQIDIIYLAELSYRWLWNTEWKQIHHQIKIFILHVGNQIFVEAFFSSRDFAIS